MTLCSNLLLLAFGLCWGGVALAQSGVEVIATGAMREVMREGRLAGQIRLDTIRDRTGLQGVGPMAHLRGELLILDGQAYTARIDTRGDVKVDTLWEVEAPFFVRANVPKWAARPLPGQVRSLDQLETYLDHLAQGEEAPFPFQLLGRVEYARYHVLDLPPGSTVRSPADVAGAKVYRDLFREEVILLGFFSRHHQTVFTHHDSYLHIHVIDQARTRMGHLDELDLGEGGLTLFLPAP